MFYCCLRSNTLPSRRTLKNSRLVCKKDDVHVCIMCLRAIMNYQVSRLWKNLIFVLFSWFFSNILISFCFFSCLYITLFVWSMASTWSCPTPMLSMKLLWALTTKTPGNTHTHTHTSIITVSLNQYIFEDFFIAFHFLCLNLSNGWWKLSYLSRLSSKPLSYYIWSKTFFWKGCSLETLSINRRIVCHSCWLRSIGDNGL